MEQEQLITIEMLERGDTVHILGIGNSMRPLLRNGLDYADVEHKSKHKLKRGDVVLYKWNDKFILHRIKKKHKGSYDMLGDANTFIEKNIPESAVIGKAVGFFRKNNYVSVDNKKYKIYWHIWIRLRPFRPLIKKINIRLKTILGTYEDEDLLKEQNMNRIMRFKVADNLYVRHFGEEYIVFPIGPAIALYKNIIRLNEVGAFLWECLMEPKTKEEMLSELMKTYEVEESDAMQAIDGFLAMLKSEQVLLIGD